jgi:hypothetical protein
MAGVFVSYRRSDSAGHTGRLMDALVEGFEPQQLFRDIEAIEAGADFVEAINRAVADSSVMLVVIGPQWLTAQTSDSKRRIDQENDFVRLEIEAALSLDLRVIPVLVGDASMPSADGLPASLKTLARRQAQEISDRRWDYDVDQLLAVMEKIPGVARRKRAQAPAQAAPASPPAPKRGMSLGMKALLGVGGVVVVLLGLGSLSNNSTDVPAVAPAPSTTTPPAPEPVKAAVVPTARAPAATVTVPPAQTARDEQPAPEPDEAPQPVQPVARAPVNLTGSWRSPDGDQLYLEHQGNEVAVIAADGSGTQGFMGQGSVHGQRVDLTLVHMQSGGSLTMQMTVSQDGRRMNGVARENLTGSSENVTLTRE